MCVTLWGTYLLYMENFKQSEASYEEVKRPTIGKFIRVLTFLSGAIAGGATVEALNKFALPASIESQQSEDESNKTSSHEVKLSLSEVKAFQKIWEENKETVADTIALGENADHDLAGDFIETASRAVDKITSITEQELSLETAREELKGILVELTFQEKQLQAYGVDLNVTQDSDSSQLMRGDFTDWDSIVAIISAETPGNVIRDQVERNLQ